jgi:uncharacterized repeat protein (TIGR01451 family)
MPAVAQAGDANPAAVADVTGVPDLTTDALTTSPVGSYTIYPAVGTLKSTNYTFKYVNGILTITAGPSTPHLAIKKTVTETTYAVVGDVLHFQIVLTNDGTVAITNPTVLDPTVTDLNCGTPPTGGLAAGGTITCTATHTITAGDISAGHVTNTATGHGTYGNESVDAGPVTVTVNMTVAQAPALDLKKEAKQTVFVAAGDTIDYTYTLTNTGNVALTNFSVTDDKIVDPNTVDCSKAAASLAPGESTTCTATYTVTGADVSSQVVTNKATAHAKFGDQTVDSPEKTVTVPINSLESFGGATATPVESIHGATSTPVHAATLPPTASNGGSPIDGPLPILILLIAIAFGGLGLLAVQNQRSSMRR